MLFTRADVLELAKLARLELTEAEVSKYTKELGNILKFVATLNNAPTSNQAEFIMTNNDINLRNDKVVISDISAEYISQSANHQDNFVAVLPVFGE